MWHSDSDIDLATWLSHFCVTWFHLSHDIGWFIYFRIVFRIGKRIWVKMKFSNVCCLMLTMLNNGWQKENWLLRDQSRLEKGIIRLNTWQKYAFELERPSSESELLIYQERTPKLLHWRYSLLRVGCLQLFIPVKFIFWQQNVNFVIWMRHVNL